MKSKEEIARQTFWAILHVLIESEIEHGRTQYEQLPQRVFDLAKHSLGLSEEVIKKYKGWEDYLRKD